MTRSSSVESLEPRRLFTATPAPFQLAGSPLVHVEDFRVTTFATGLNFPNGMAQLADGSVLVATNKPGPDGNGYFGAATGQLIRLYDLDGDGTADGSEILADNLPREITDVRVSGNLVFVTSAGQAGVVPPTITVLKTGSRVYRPYAVVDTLTFTFPSPWMHYTYALATRPTPGAKGSTDVFFNIGSQDDGDTTPTNLTTSLDSAALGAIGTLEPDSIYKVTVGTNKRGRLTYTDLTQVAYGLRNAAGIAVNPTTGNLYFEDNGINGGPTGDGDPQLSTDELNVLAANQIGNGSPPDYGFAHDYIHQTTGARVGSGAVQPLTPFLPINGSYSEGPQDIAFTPSSFPAGLNNGVLLGFYGQAAYSGDGIANDQNPVNYVDLRTGRTFQIISNNEPSIGHPVGWLGTADSVFFSDLSPTNDFSTPGSGVIYQIKANPAVFSVTGKAFTDTNHDGVFDQGDTIVKGARIYVDENQNGVFDGNDRATTTDKNGNYAFSLPSGYYILHEDIPAGQTASGANYFIARLGSGHRYRKSYANVNFGTVAS